MLLDTDRGNGIIDPHISSVTGVNVFDLFVGVTLKDGVRGYLVKEYEVDRIVDSFTLSFITMPASPMWSTRRGCADSLSPPQQQ